MSQKTTDTDSKPPDTAADSKPMLKLGAAKIGTGLNEQSETAAKERAFRELQERAKQLAEDVAQDNEDEARESQPNGKAPYPDSADKIVPHDQVTQKPGAVRPTGAITLHTRMAHRLFYGRQPNRENPNAKPIIGLKRFVYITNQLCDLAAADDPFADWMLIKTEEAIKAAQLAMAKHIPYLQSLMEGEDSRITYAPAGSTRPVTLPLEVRYTYGHRGAALLDQFDRLVELALGCMHVGLLTSDEWDRTVKSSARLIRRAFAAGAQYRFAGVQRQDCYDGNAKVAEACAKYGELPQDILTGERRGQWAPEIRQARRPT